MRSFFLCTCGLQHAVTCFSSCFASVLSNSALQLSDHCTFWRVYRQTASTTLFRSLGGVKAEDGGADAGAATAVLAATLRSYFFLKVPLAPLYQGWSEGDHRMAAVAACISGVRVVR